MKEGLLNPSEKIIEVDSSPFPSLFVKKLKLTNFRNYKEAEVELEPCTVIITGQNGSGKTNLLEAISLLVPGKGIRGAKLNTIDKKNFEDGEDGAFHGLPWSIYAEIATPSGDVSIGTGREANRDSDKRIVKIDGEKKRGQSELAHYFSVCSLTPPMDQTFSDGATSRRAFLDRIVTNFYPEHIKHLAIYSHAKSERSKLITGYKMDAIWAETLEKRMAEQAVAIAAARLETIEMLQKEMDNNNSSFPNAVVSIKGSVEESLRSMSALHAEEEFASKLESSRYLDRETGRTNVGPHRSDFVAYHSEKNLPADLCSTGEQKALLLSITMASARARKSWSGSCPVMILDEVVAHLDEQKRASFFEELDQLSAQSWLTGTDMSFFSDFRGKKQLLTIENSRIVV